MRNQIRRGDSLQTTAAGATGGGPAGVAAAIAAARAGAKTRLIEANGCLGVREGRRVRGLYQVTTDDLIKGARHDDAVCRVTGNAAALAARSNRLPHQLSWPAIRKTIEGTRHG